MTWKYTGIVADARFALLDTACAAKWDSAAANALGLRWEPQANAEMFLSAAGGAARVDAMKAKVAMIGAIILGGGRSGL